MASFSFKTCPNAFWHWLYQFHAHFRGTSNQNACTVVLRSSIDVRWLFERRMTIQLQIFSIVLRFVDRVHQGRTSISLSANQSLIRCAVWAGAPSCMNFEAACLPYNKTTDGIKAISNVSLYLYWFIRPGN